MIDFFEKYGNPLDMAMADYRRSLGQQAPNDLGRFSDSQNNAILIVAATCGAISLITCLGTIRWFLMMEKNFRHKLILILIASDEIKALFDFVFPIIHSVNANDVSTETVFCQASGWFIQFATEASDFAMLIIAVHTMLYIFVPFRNAGKGGLYPYRRWIWPVWLALPCLSASLAFIHGRYGYVTAGTLCFLPKRPFWYRLFLSWVPRYIIFLLILVMYASVYLHVHLKFRGWNKVGDDMESAGIDTAGLYGTVGSMRGETRTQMSIDLTASYNNHHDSVVASNRPSNASEDFTITPQTAQPPRPPQPPQPWDGVSFITSKPLREPSNPRLASLAEDRGLRLGDIPPAGHFNFPQSLLTPISEKDAYLFEDRKSTSAPVKSRTGGMRLTTNGLTTNGLTTNGLTRSVRGSLRGSHKRTKPEATEIQRTRKAILRQLRLLFMYPAVYFVMWLFPFIGHVLNYSDYWVSRPPFWLSVLSAATIALQAAADCIIFSIMEKPWKRIRPGSRLLTVRIYNHLRRKDHDRRGTKRKLSLLKPVRQPKVVATDVTAPMKVDNGDSVTPGPLKRRKTMNWWDGKGEDGGRKASFWYIHRNGSPILSPGTVDGSMADPIPQAVTPGDEDKEETVESSQSSS